MHWGHLEDQVANATLSNQSFHGSGLLFEGMVQLKHTEYKLPHHVERNFLLDWGNYGNNKGNENTARRALSVFWHMH
jgi:hypothetical protein